jgi:hypothetical protein
VIPESKVPEARKPTVVPILTFTGSVDGEMIDTDAVGGSVVALPQAG